jgi:tRNA A37 threonylcarbamoyladenosine synthetase subunit TsaC/SUA5/YrdC
MKIIKESDLNAVELACDFLRQGKVISFSSDTVYGVAADAKNFDAVNTLYEIKNRDSKKPIAIFVNTSLSDSVSTVCSPYDGMSKCG